MKDNDESKSHEELIRSLRLKVDRILGKEEIDTDALRTEPVEIETVVPGDYHPTPFGPCYVVKKRYNLGDFQGRLRIREALDVELGQISVLGKCNIQRDWKPDQALFLDTETTGLSAAEGAFAFMIGLGFFEEDSFVLWQLFARDYGEEPATLHELGKLCEQFNFLVTFNGKNFDIPLLDARLGINGFGQRLGSMPHIDLLLPARRIWKYKLESCSLGSLENSVLGFFRKGDIPSFEIPDLYYGYLRDKDARKLKAVFDHNGPDVVSMVVLMAKIYRILEDKETARLTPEEMYALGRIRLAQDDRERSFECLKNCVTKLPAFLREKAQKEMSLILRRWKKYSEAAMLWKQMTKKNPEQLFAYEQLAIFLEHRLKDYDQALKIIEKADRHVVFSGYDQRLGWKKRKKRVLQKQEKTTKEQSSN